MSDENARQYLSEMAKARQVVKPGRGKYALRLMEEDDAA